MYKVGTLALLAQRYENDDKVESSESVWHRKRKMASDKKEVLNTMVNS